MYVFIWKQISWTFFLDCNLQSYSYILLGVLSVVAAFTSTALLFEKYIPQLNLLADLDNNTAYVELQKARDEWVFHLNFFSSFTKIKQQWARFVSDWSSLGKWTRTNGLWQLPQAEFFMWNPFLSQCVVNFKIVCRKNRLKKSRSCKHDSFLTWLLSVYFTIYTDMWLQTA